MRHGRFSSRQREIQPIAMETSFPAPAGTALVLKM
jgi:hypothetical protein